MSRLLYYLVLKPLSFLPLPVLYRFADLLFLILYHLLGYRSAVVMGNLRRSFPDWSEAELQKLARRFYLHFCDLIVESIRMFSISREEAVRRCRVINPEVTDRFFREGKNIIMPAGHYGNWELAALVIGVQIAHLPLGVYAPLRNKFFNRKVQQSRGRYRLELIPKKEIAPYLQENKDQLSVTLMGADQSPTFSKNVHWTRFLNQDTAVMLGTERFAREYDMPVVFARILKRRRGYYEIEFELLEEHPRQTAPGAITEAHTRILEEEILADPAYWLWTHKRWKRKREEATP